MFASFGKLTEPVMEELRANFYLIILVLLITGETVIEVPLQACDSYDFNRILRPH